MSVGRPDAGVDRVLAAVTDRLLAAGCVASAEEAALFLAAAPDRRTLDSWLHRREQGEPPAWITGTTTFCGRTLHVAPGVYVPRTQTEELARRAASLLPAHGRAVDLCTGAGAVAAHLRHRVPTASVLGIDRDATAAACARRNGVPAVVGNLDGPLPRGPRFDVVTAVAPYVPTDQLRLLPADVRRHEPRSAHDGGTDGLQLVRRVVGAAASLLRVGGWLLVEVGGDQHRALAPVLAGHRFDEITAWWDDEGDLRGLAARRAGASSRRPGRSEPGAGVEPATS